MSQEQDEQKMLRARELIRHKRFDEARALLRTTTHPRAVAWLNKLDTIDPPNRQQPPSPMQQTQPNRAVVMEQPQPSRTGMAEPVPAYPSETTPRDNTGRGTQGISLEKQRRMRDRNLRRGARARNLLLFVVVLMFVGVVAAAAFVFVVPNLNLNLLSGSAGGDLATQFPANTVVFAQIRTDDAFLQEMESFVPVAYANVPGAGEFTTLSAALDELVADTLPGETFTGGIRPWLGDEAAFGIFNADVVFDTVPDNDSEAGIAAIIQITSKAEAQAFLEKTMPGITPTEADGYTVYNMGVPGSPEILVNDVQILITTDRAAMTAPDSAKLSAVVAYTETTAMLPAEAYDMQFYVDAGTVQNSILTRTGGTLPPAQQPIMNALADFIGQQALGWTFEDDNTLILDVVHNAGDNTALRNQGISLVGASSPVDSAFLNRIPADAAIVFAGTEARVLYDLVVNNAGTIASLQGSDPAAVQSAVSELDTLLAGYRAKPRK